MATRYIDNQTKTCDVVETLEKENNGVWKARWTIIREGEGERGKIRRTVEESIRTTTESAR